ncbi:hypothetical protein [Mesorhizobium sp.]|uniref:hypothetical protein n=1 Tax=Mesorhizobium sp. TaxID=1871066 RepID=UPI00341E2EA6
MTTSNHEVIRAWIEAREGRPAVVATAGKVATLRVDFGAGDEDLRPIEWEDFFKVMDDNNLARSPGHDRGGQHQPLQQVRPARAAIREVTDLDCY